MIIKLHRNTLPIFSFFVWKNVILYGQIRHRCKHKLRTHLACYYMCILKGKATLAYNTGFYSLYLCDLPFFSPRNFCSRLVVWGHMIFSSLFVSYTEISFGSKRKLSTKNRHVLIMSSIKLLKAWKEIADIFYFLKSSSYLLITRLV